MIPELRPNKNPFNEADLIREYGIGRYGMGNIDLYNRPVYVHPDGSVSTTYSVSIGEDDNTVLIPTVAYNPQNGRPYIMSIDESINRYKRTGEHLGKFRSEAEANDYAERLHQQQAAIYGRR